MTAQLSLDRLLAAVVVRRHGEGVELCFLYPSSETGRPVLLLTSDGRWALRGRDGARGGQVRTFACARIVAMDSLAPPSLPRPVPEPA